MRFNQRQPNRRPLRTAIVLMAVLLAASLTAQGQLALAKRHVLMMTYPEGPTLSVALAGTQRLPRASGEAKIERKKGTTEIEIELDEMKPAGAFGGDFNTYVLWVASPEGHVDNAGEFILQGNRSKLNVTTGLETFGMLITAEPHFLVDRPSSFVVLENSKPKSGEGLVKVGQVEYETYDSLYHFERESLFNVAEVGHEVRPDLDAARTSIELAERAGAQEFASDELRLAKEQLREAESAMDVGAGKRNLMLASHEVIRLAVKAEKMARERSFEAALMAERQARAAEIDDLQTRIDAAQSQAERSRLLADQRRMEAEMESEARREAQQRAKEFARRAELAEKQAAQSEQARRQAEAQAAQAAKERREAELRAEQERRERQQALNRLESAMAKVADVRRSSEGLIINLPDILFDFDKADLKPQAREILAKLSGVLQVSPEFELTVEGHTDHIGSHEYNKNLSQRRADSVMAYLVNQGVSSDLVAAKAFGEERPIAANETEEGRQKNRRVEIHISNSPLPVQEISSSESQR